MNVYSTNYLAGEKLAGENGTAGLLFCPVKRFNGAFSGVCCLLLDVICKIKQHMLYIFYFFQTAVRILRFVKN